MSVRTEGAYTERDYNGYIIAHLHGTATFKVLTKDREIICFTATLKEAKKVIDNQRNV